MDAATFSVAADPNTDIWKKPPSHDVFTAPYRVHSSRPTAHFRSATLTFTAAYRQQFDQAGILLLFTHPSHPRKWIKAGVELFDGAPRLSAVACDAWADWSVAPAPHPDAVRDGACPVALRVESEESSSGRSLWVHAVDRDSGAKTPLREICWPFGDAAGDGWQLHVAAAVARPDKTASGKLEASFRDFVVEWKNGN